MAVVTFVDGRSQDISRNQSHKIWAILHGEAEPETDKQADFVSRIKNLYLNWRKAPDSYIQAHYDRIMELAMGDWRKDHTGAYSNPSDTFSYQFAKKWGLYDHGRPTSTALSFNRQTSLGGIWQERQ